MLSESVVSESLRPNAKLALDTSEVSISQVKTGTQLKFESRIVVACQHIITINGFLILMDIRHGMLD
jgi:hypothetical protein